MLTNRYLVVWINSHESDSPVEMKLELPNQCTVQDCVALSLKSINDLISKENKDYTLSEDPSNYLFYISKKNGMPKTDYPRNISLFFLSFKFNFLKKFFFLLY